MKMEFGNFYFIHTNAAKFRLALYDICTVFLLLIILLCIFFPMDIPLFNIFIERETSFPFVAQLIFSMSTAAIQILALSFFY